MNILIPHTWLLEHLDTEATPPEIQRLLSLSGPSVERIYDIEGESVYDIEVTTNRVDCMSVRGIAREAATILTQAGVHATLKPVNIKTTLPQATGTSHLSIKIKNDPKLCHRILCVVIHDVKRNASPEWLQKRLRQIGINVHDAVIDITNYVTHEYGHPCHAFDYDKLLAHGIIKVTTATKGQSFAIIDGASYTTVGGEIVFENEAGEIIDLPAIKGTANTSINDHTKNVCFWIESLDHQKVRFASMAHAIRTVAAQLEEKDLSPELADDTFARGLDLYAQLANGRVDLETYTDIYPGKLKPEAIQLNVSQINAYLGIEVEKAKIIAILKDLECEAEIHDSILSVTPPLWRTDLHIGVDIVEEIARIYGYHHLPNALMTSAIPVNRPTDVNFELEHDAKRLLAALGGQEVYTYSLISEAQAKLEGEEHIKLKNPLTEDLTYLRRTLWASHLAVLATNPTRKDLMLFEFANTYVPPQATKLEKGHTLPTEEYHLTLTGNLGQRQLKGALEALAQSLYLEPVHYVQTSGQDEVLIQAGEQQIGHLLRLPQPEYAQVTVLDLDWKALLALARKYPQVKPIPKVAAIHEDMTFSVPVGVYIQNILETVTGLDPLISKVEIKDTYKDRVSLAITYQPESEMNASSLMPLRQKIVATLQTKHQAKLIGSLA